MELNELVMKAQDGDSAAFALICRRFEGLVKKYAFQPHLRPLGEDALAEGWLAVAQAVRTYQSGAGVQFPGYVESRVRYALWNLFKRERRRWQHELPLEGGSDAEDGGTILDTLAGAQNVAAQVERKLSVIELRQAIACLPDRQQQAILKTLAADGSLTVAAAQLGVSVQAIYNLRQRGIARLKKLCAGMYENERG